MFVFVPTHRLAEELLARVQKLEPDIKARVMRGLSQSDPDDSTRKMCRLDGLSTSIVGRGISLNALCSRPGNVCKHHPEANESPCAYRSQLSKEIDVWILPAEYAFLPRPRELAEPTLIVFDEAFWNKGLEGFDDLRPLEIAIRDLEHYDDACRKVASAARDAGPLCTQDLIAAGLTPGEVDRYLCELRAWRESLGLGPNATPIELERARTELARTDYHRREMLFESILRALGRKAEYAAEIVYEPGKSRLRCYRSTSIDADWLTTPVLVLDATLNEPLVRLHFPQIETHEIDVAMPHARVRQVSDKALSASMMIPTPTTSGRKNAERKRNVTRLRNYLIVEYNAQAAKRPRPKEGDTIMLVICQLALERELRQAELPPGIAIAHYNAIAGLDQYKDVRKLVVVGRLLAPPNAIEQMASVLLGHPVTSVKKWYDGKSKVIEPRRGPVQIICNPRHPDPLVEAIRSQICEGELIQAVGRARGVRRTAETPLEIDILTNVPLPLVIDELVIWDEIIPNEFSMELVTKGFVALTKGEMTRLHPERWKNADGARYAIRAMDGAGGVADAYWGGKTPMYTPIGELPPQPTMPWVVAYKRPGRGRGATWYTAMVHRRTPAPWSPHAPDGPRAAVSSVLHSAHLRAH